VHKKYVETGDRALISYHGRWYLIQKFDSMDLGYLIMKRVKVAEYEWYKKEIERSGERDNTYLEILDEADLENGSGSVDQNDGAKSSADSNDVGNGRRNQSVLSVGSEQVERESGIDGQSGADHARSGTDRQGGETRVKKSRKSNGDTITISKGEMAKLHANYAGEKVLPRVR
jgi:hypothetical protein